MSEGRSSGATRTGSCFFVLFPSHRRFNCHAYCLMGNHYHLVIETPDGNLSKGMRQLNGVYTQAFNRRHHRVGHLFQGRLKGILVSDGIGEATIWENLQAQSLLGVEGFAEALKDHVAGRRKLSEVPKAQRLMGRVSLKKLFGEVGWKTKRDRRIRDAVYTYGYSQIEVARHLELHYSTISGLIKRATKEQE